jgi:hypothetical protein
MNTDEELKKCKEDIVYFAENYFHIINLYSGGGVIKLYNVQKRILNSLISDNHLIVNSSRQTGKTVLETIYALWVACFYPNRNIVIVMCSADGAVNIFKRIKMAYEKFPSFLKPDIQKVSKTSWSFNNGSKINVHSITSTFDFRGLAVSDLVVDEMSFMSENNLENLLIAMAPIISSKEKSKIFITSTPNTRNNKFFQLYSLAGKGFLQNWKAEKINWQDIPNRDENWKQQMIQLLGSEEKFAQEFENKFL